MLSQIKTRITSSSRYKVIEWPALSILNSNIIRLIIVNDDHLASVECNEFMIVGITLHSVPRGRVGKACTASQAWFSLDVLKKQGEPRKFYKMGDLLACIWNLKPPAGIEHAVSSLETTTWNSTDGNKGRIRTAHTHTRITLTQTAQLRTTWKPQQLKDT